MTVLDQKPLQYKRGDQTRGTASTKENDQKKRQLKRQNVDLGPKGIFTATSAIVTTITTAIICATITNAIIYTIITTITITAATTPILLQPLLLVLLLLLALLPESPNYLSHLPTEVVERKAEGKASLDSRAAFQRKDDDDDDVGEVPVIQLRPLTPNVPPGGGAGGAARTPLSPLPPSSCWHRATR